MDIDLLFTAQGECGLICSDNLVKKAAGVVFNVVNKILTLEYNDMDYMDLNIPVEPEYLEILDYCALIHVGSFKNGHIAQAYQVPFMIADDPYRAEAMGRPAKPEKELMAFERFVKGCQAGQPVHRDDLGNEETMGCILGDACPSDLQFAPHLARRRTFETTPKLAPGNVPGLGLGSSGSGGGSVRTPVNKDTGKNSGGSD